MSCKTQQANAGAQWLMEPRFKLKPVFQQQDGECILGHTEPRHYIIASLILILAVFIVIYILYIHILVSWRVLFMTTNEQKGTKRPFLELAQIGELEEN